MGFTSAEIFNVSAKVCQVHLKEMNSCGHLRKKYWPRFVAVHLKAVASSFFFLLDMFQD